MKKQFLVLLLLAFALPAGAQDQCPPIRPDHPRIMFNADTWPSLVARANGQELSQLKALLKKADELPSDPVCEGYGPVERTYGLQSDGSYVSAGSPIPDVKEFGNEAAICALAWRFTGEEKYLLKAKKMLLVSVDAYTKATENRRPVAWSSTTRLNALCAYDWIYEALTPQERESFIVPMLEHVRLVQPEAGLKIPRQPVGSKETGFYGMGRLLWFAGLAAEGDGFCDELAHKMLEDGYARYMEVIQYRNDTAGDDGGLVTQALDYVIKEYPYSHYVFFYSHESATGINIADRFPSMALLPYWVWWNWIRDGEKSRWIRHHGAGDTYHDVNTAPSSQMYIHCQNTIHFFSESNPEAVDVAKALCAYLPVRKSKDLNYPVMPFLLDKPEGKGADLESSTLKARHFETVGQVFMRSGWTEDATYCLFTAGGKLDGHRHYDENSFTIYKYDHLALDSGNRGKQSDLNLRYWFSQSVAHNLVLIQKPGEPLPHHWGQKTDAPAANLNYGGQTTHTPATVLAFETDKDYSYVASDAAACYGEKASECIRQFVYLHPDCFVVYDRVTSSDPSYEKPWLLHFQNEPEVKGKMVSASAGGGKLFCQTLLPEKSRIELIGGPGKEFWVRDRNFAIAPKVAAKILETARKRGRGPYTGAWRIELKPSVEAAEARFLNVITVGADGVARPVKAKYIREDTRDGVRLTVKGKQVTVFFNRHGETGGVIILNGEKRPLATTVQPQAGAILH